MGQSDGVTTDQATPDAGSAGERADRLRAISDSMMAAMSNLRAKEAEKRTLAMGSDRFDELAREIERESRVIFDLAAEQRAIGENVPSSEGRATNDIDPR